MIRSGCGRWTARLGGGVAALCLASGLVAGRAEAAAKISVPATRLDLGELVAGEETEAMFALTNAGSDPLKIERVTVSCGCVTTSFPETLQPGEKGTLKVKLVSSVLWNGTLEKQITVFSNDPEQPAFELKLGVKMRPLLRFTPQNPLTVSYKKGDVIRQVFTIEQADVPVAIKGVSPGGPGVEARLLPAENGAAPGVTRVEITVRPPETGGDFSTIANLETTHAKTPSYPLIINAVAQDGVTISPSFLYLTNLGAGPGTPKLVALFKRTGGFRVLEVKSDRPELKVELRPLEPGLPPGSENFRELSVRYLGGWPKGPVSGKITVTTDDPVTPKVEIKYEGVVE